MNAAPAPRLAIGLLAGTLAAEIGAYAMPLIVGGMGAALQVGEGVIGLVLAGQVALTAAAAMGLGLVVDRLDRRALALVGVALIAAGNFGSAMAADLAQFAASRLIGGVGEGAALAAIAASAAQTRNPDRTFAWIWFAIVAMAVALYLGLPPVAARMGERTAFVALGVVSLVCLIGVLWAPRGVGARARNVRGAPMARLAALALIGAVCALAIAANGFFYFVDGIGQGAGLSAAGVGQALALAAVVSLAGPLAARAVAGAGFGVWPILVGIAACGCGAVLVTTAGGATFVAALALSCAAYVYALPLLMGFAARLDPTGGLAAAARGAQWLGNAVTIAISGTLLLDHAAYGLIGAVGGASALASMALVAAAFALSGRTRPAIPARAPS